MLLISDAKIRGGLIVSPPWFLCLRALRGVLGRLLGLGKLPLLVLLAAFYGLVIGYYVRQEAAGKFVKNMFRQFCGSAFAAQKADDTIVQVCKIDVQPKKEFF